jgi:hypothetical protein
MIVSKLKILGAATLASVLAVGGIQVMARQLGGRNPTTPPDPATSKTADPRKSLAERQLKLARQALENLESSIKIGAVSPIDSRFALWGRRQVEALRASGAGKEELVKALEDYLKRMKDQVRSAEELYKTGRAPRVDLLDIQYHALEAEMWLHLVRFSSRPSVGGRPPGQLDLSEEDFQDVTTFEEAVEVVKRELIREGKAEYAALLSEQRVRLAVQTAIQAYEGYMDDANQTNSGSKEYFNGTVKPVFIELLAKGTWPPNCAFFGFYTLSSAVGGKPVSYDGFWLRLKVVTPKGKFGAFALPVVDMAYGRSEF